MLGVQYLQYWSNVKYVDIACDVIKLLQMIENHIIASDSFELKLNKIWTEMFYTPVMSVWFIVIETTYLNVICDKLWTLQL